MKIKLNEITNICQRAVICVDYFGNPEMFRSEAVLHRSSYKKCSKICSRCTGTPILCNFIEMTSRRMCSPVSLLLIFRTSVLNNTCEGLLLPIKGHPVAQARSLVSYPIMS